MLLKIRKPYQLLLLPFLLIFSLLSSPVGAISNHTIPVRVDLDKKFILDGKVLETFWQDALKLRLNIETSPGLNIPAVEESSVRMIVSESVLYVAFTVKDSNPSEIKADIRQRDNLSGQDQVGIILDLFGDGRRAYQFFISASGSILDSLYDEERQSETSAWDVAWAAKSRLSPQGYNVEVAIPLNKLEQDRGDSVKWGVDFVRFRPRELRRRFSFAGLDRSIRCYLCQLQRFSIDNPPQDYKLSLIKSEYTLTGTASQTKSIASNDFSETAKNQEFGLDWQGSFSNNTAVSITLNPDFSQVESDGIRLDVNARDALSFDEQRPFFVAVSEAYAQPLRFFYSRNIQAPSAATSVYWRASGQEFSALYARDTKTEFIVPGSVSSFVDSILTTDGQVQESSNIALRYKKDINKDLNIATFLSARSGGRYKNQMLALDGRWNLTESTRLEWLGAFSETQIPPKGSESLEKLTGNIFHFDFAHASKLWNGSAHYTRISSGFRADLGFIPRSDWQTVNGDIARVWQHSENNFFVEQRLGVSTNASETLGGQSLTNQKEIFWQASAHSQTEFRFSVGKRKRLHLDEYYNEPYIEGAAETRITNQLSIGITGLVGDQVDFVNQRLGRTKEWGVNATFDVTDKLQIQLSLDEWVFTAEDDEVFAVFRNELRMYYYFSQNLYVRWVRQSRNVDRNDVSYVNPFNAFDDKRIDQQFLLAYRPSVRSLLYLGYSSNDFEEELAADFYNESNNTWFLKFSVGFG